MLPNKEKSSVKGSGEITNTAKTSSKGSPEGQRGTTFTREGSTIMAQQEYVDFIARNLASLSVFIVRQSPEDADFQCDIDEFVGSFSHVVDGVRVRCTPWKNGPGWRDGIFQEERRNKQEQRWNRHRRRLAQHIPSMVDTGKVEPFNPDDESDWVDEDFSDGEWVEDPNDTYTLAEEMRGEDIEMAEVADALLDDISSGDERDLLASQLELDTDVDSGESEMDTGEDFNSPDDYVAGEAGDDGSDGPEEEGALDDLPNKSVKATGTVILALFCHASNAFQMVVKPTNNCVAMVQL